MVSTDVAYIVRPGNTNPELRWSLRSLHHLPHARVHIAGHRPSWVTGVHHVPTDQAGPKYANAWGNVVALARCEDVAEEVTLFNDDFYVMAPHPDGIPVLHLGPLAEQVAEREHRLPSAPYTHLLRRTLDHLQAAGIPEPIAYTAHVPMPLHRTDLATTVDYLERLDPDRTAPLSWRTVHGNLHQIGGTQVRDVKVNGRDGVDLEHSPLLSTADTTWRTASRVITRRLARTPMRYER